jgi:hypothetical protein
MILYVGGCQEDRPVHVTTELILEAHGDVLPLLEELAVDEPHPYPEPPVRHMVIVPRFAMWYKVSAYTPYCDGGWRTNKTFASVNFLEGGRLYQKDKPYPEVPIGPHGRAISRAKVLASWLTNEKVIALPRSLRQYHEERVEMADGTWDHRWVVNVPGYGLAIPRDRITKYERIDCLRYEYPYEAMRYGVEFEQCVFYERVWVEASPDSPDSRSE